MVYIKPLKKSLSFNPFKNLIAPSISSPFSQILNSSLFGKLRSTFQIFSGNQETFGIIDYCSFGLLFALQLPLNIIIAQKDDKPPLGFKLLYQIPAAFLFCIAWLVRHVLALIMTILVAPIVILTHLITMQIAKKDFEAASKLTVHETRLSDHWGCDTTLGRALHVDNVMVEAADSEMHSVSYDSTTENFGLDYDVGKHDWYCSVAKKDGPLLDSPEQKNAYRALIRLNLFNIAGAIEKQGFHPAMGL